MWPALLAGCLGVYLFKLAGMSVPLAVLRRPRVQRLAALLPIVLLAALIGVQTFGSGRAVSLDARFAGVLLGVSEALWLWQAAPVQAELDKPASAITAPARLARSTP